MLDEEQQLLDWGWWKWSWVTGPQTPHRPNSMLTLVPCALLEYIYKTAQGINNIYWVHLKPTQQLEWECHPWRVKQRLTLWKRNGML